jgi:hypothetical protein
MSLLSALQELAKYSNVIKPVMTDPEIPRTVKRKTLNDMVEMLTPNTFKQGIVADQIMLIINMKEEECKLFSNTEMQVNSILVWLPRMSLHRDKLYKKVANNRKNYGLEV